MPDKTTKTTKKTKKKTSAQKSRGQAAALAQQQQRYRDQLAGLIPRLLQQPDYSALMKVARQLYPDFSGQLLGPGQLRGQARGDVNAIMAPQIRGIRDLYADRSKRMGQAYTYYSGQLAPTMAGYADQLQAGQAAGVAEMAQGNEALASFLQGRGNELAGGVASAVTGMGAPEATMANTAGLASGLASGSAGQTYALGDASLDLMRGEAQSANLLARKEPLRTIQRGQEELLASQRQLSVQEQEDIDELEAKIPELAYQVYNTLQERGMSQRGMKATRAQTMMEFLSGQQTGDFNRTAGAAAILDNILSSGGSELGDYLASEASLTGSQTSSTGDKTPRMEILASVGKDINAWIQSNPFFVVPEGDQDLLTPGMQKGSRKAKGKIKESRRRIAAQVRALLPNATPQEIKTLVDNALRSIGMNIKQPPKGAGPGVQTGPPSRGPVDQPQNPNRGDDTPIAAEVEKASGGKLTVINGKVVPKRPPRR